MRLKRGVRVAGVRGELVLGLLIAESCHKAIVGPDGPEMIITSLGDGRHSEGSLHYKGLAVDLRSRYYHDSDEIDAFVALLKRELGPEWDVVREATHVHIEFDPDPA